MLSSARRPPARPATGQTTTLAVTMVGRIVAVKAGRCQVDFDGNCAGPLQARSLVQVSLPQLCAAGPEPQVLLGFEGIDTSRPIVMGLLHQDLIAPPLRTAEIRIDGKRIELSAERELTLRCGEASITLRADGTVQVKGRELSSRASGRNRIVGATVAIN